MTAIWGKYDELELRVEPHSVHEQIVESMKCVVDKPKTREYVIVLLLKEQKPANRADKMTQTDSPLQ